MSENDVIFTIIGVPLLTAALIATIILSQLRQKERVAQQKAMEAQRKLEMHIICPNCKFEGQGRQLGGVNGCFFVVLLFCGVVPGILYLMMNERTGIACPRCGLRIR